MSKSKLSLAGAGVAFLGILVLWSCKDNFTDEDLINKQHELAQDSIQLSIVVYNGSTSFKGSSGGRTASAKGVNGLTVLVTDKDGTLKTATTDASGIAIFKNLNPGSVSGTVSGTGYTTASFVISLVNTTNSSQPGTAGNNNIQAGVLLPVYETAGANTAKVSGKATCETNLLNDTRENVPDGVKVSFSISTASVDFNDNGAVIGAILGIFDKLGAGSFKNARIESIQFETTFTADITGGAYSITLPTSADGLTYDVSFPDFRADQSIAINNYLNTPAGSTRNVVTLPTLFTQNTALDSDFTLNNPIPTLIPIQIDIAAPPAAGTGAAVTAKLVATGIGATYTILAPGSGYPASSATIPVTVTGGDFDSSVPGAAAAALNATSNAAGQITALTGTTGLGYRSQPTLTIGGGGSGAVVVMHYASTVAPLGGTGANAGTTLTSGGTGYVVAPTFEVRGYDYAGEYLEATATATVSGGAVVSFNVPATTFARIISATFIPQERINAFVDGNGDIGVTSSGGITDGTGTNQITPDVFGAAYDPLQPPAVTVRDLRNAGSGAVVIANMDASGTIDFLSVQFKGSGYSQASYANFPLSPEPFQFSSTNDSNASDNIKSKITVRPGLTRIFDVHYGTGIRERKVE